MANETMTKRSDVDVFPFDTDNPSGVPGSTGIASNVVASIAGHAAAQVEGVARLGGGGIVRAVADIVSDTAAGMGRGIDVESGKIEAILELEVTVSYGTPIPEIVQNVRDSVARQVNDLTGLVAKEINISVEQIEFPSDMPSGRVE